MSPQPNSQEPDASDESLLAFPEHARQALLNYRADLERRHQFLIALGRAGRVVLQARSPQEIYQAIGDQLRELDIHVAAFRLAPDLRSMTATYISLEPRILQTALQLAGFSDIGVRVPLAPDGFFSSIITEGESKFLERTADVVSRGFPRFGGALVNRLLAITGAEQSVYAPLVVEGTTDGILALVGTDLTPADLPAVSAFAAQASIALESARLLESLKASRERMRRTAHQAIAVQEEERRRLSKAIHDSTAQRLTALHLRLELIAEEVPEDLRPLRERLEQAVDATGEIAAQLRSMVEHLRPPGLDALGLGRLLHSLCQEWQDRAHLTVEFRGVAPHNLPSAVESTLYRFLCEALANTARFGEATQVQVELHADQEVTSLSVVDDSRGVELDARLTVPGLAGGLGLLGVRERLEVLGGQLEVERLPGGGTRIVASIPA